MPHQLPEDVPTTVPVAQKLLQAYVLQHATQVCHATCTLCRQTIAWLEPRGAVPLGVEMLRSVNRDGKVTR